MVIYSLGFHAFPLRIPSGRTCFLSAAVTKTLVQPFKNPHLRTEQSLFMHGYAQFPPVGDLR